jgi:integrase
MPNLNDKFIKSLPLPKGKHKIYWDDRLIGLGIRITDNNSKSFVLRYVINGRERKYTLGGYPALSYSAARDMAIQLKGEITKGHDPLDERQAIQGTPTVKQLAEDFLKAKEKVLRPSTLKDYREFFFKKHIIAKFGNLKIDSIGKKEIENFHRSFSETPRMGNRLLEIMRVMFNTAVSWEILEKNPAQGIKKFPEHKRERYLSEDEISRLTEALDAEPNQMNANIIRLILLTGSRKGEVLSARWQDFEGEVWAKPAFLTKQNKISRIPLSEEAVDILQKMKTKIVSEKKLATFTDNRIVSTEQYLFYNTQTKTHQKDIKRFWLEVCKKAKIKDATIHDLRHTFASILVSNGVGLEVIGKLVGHSNIRTTQRYAHLANSSLKQATSMLAGKVMKKA